MSQASICPECGVPLPADAPEGVCPACALKGAMEEQEQTALNRSESGLERGECQLPRAFGEYELLEEIAHGGMGIVYRARQKSLDRIVAVKLLQFGSLSSAEYVKRFRAEASAAASLQHPNIVSVHEVGVHEGQHYLVMNFVNGPPLSRLAGQGPLPAKTAAAYLECIAEAVHCAHEHGILHRDLKPSNVLIDENNRPQVTDFGLAKRMDGESSLTLSGQVLGSPNYMPPEQASAEHGKVTRRSDVYGLGAILYHLLTGRPPFQTASLNEAIQQVTQVEPVAPRLLNPSVPVDLETICLKCLEKETGRRYPTAQMVADELCRFLNGESIQARPVGMLERFWRWCRRKPLVASLCAVTAAAIVGGLFVSWVGFMAAKAQSEAAERSARTASRVSEVLLELIAAAEPASGKTSGAAVRAMLDHFSTGLEEKLAGEPEVEALVRTAIASAYLECYESVKASNHLSHALDLLGTQIKLDSMEAARIFQGWGQYYNLNEQTSEAHSFFSKAHELYIRRLVPEDIRLLQVKIALATCERDRKQFASGYRRLWEVVEIARTKRGQPSYDLGRANALRFLAGMYRVEQNFRDAQKCIKEWREALALHHPANHQLVLLADFQAALVLGEQARLSDNGKATQESIAILDRVYRVQLESLPADHIDIIETLYELATAHFQAGHTDDGVRLILQAYETSSRKAGPDHNMTQQVRARIQELYELTKRPELELALRFPATD